MWENAAQVQIVPSNWWQYAGRVWCHANTAHWNNSLHIGGTWYCSSDPYTISVCARLQRPEEGALTRWGMLSTGGCTLPGRTAAHVWWTALFSSATVEGGHPCLGSRLTFEPKHYQLGSCLDSELASPWPQHPVGPKRLPCHVLYGAGHCLGCTQCYAQTPASPMATFDSSGSGCTDVGPWLHPPRPAHSSPHGGLLHPIPWLTGHDFHH